MSNTTSVTAAILVIGDEILSGRTKDKNIGYIAEYLTRMGIDMREFERVVQTARMFGAFLSKDPSGIPVKQEDESRA